MLADNIEQELAERLENELAHINYQPQRIEAIQATLATFREMLTEHFNRRISELELGLELERFVPDGINIGPSELVIFYEKDL